MNRQSDVQPFGIVDLHLFWPQKARCLDVGASDERSGALHSDGFISRL
jgi:hypothetical protein